MMVYGLVSTWSADVCQKSARSLLLKLGLMMVQKVQKKSIIEFNGQKTLYPIHLESNPLLEWWEIWALQLAFRRQ